MANLPGAKTFLQMQQEVSETAINLSIATTTTNPTLARIKQYINDSYREICSEQDWWFLYAEGSFNSVIGQTTPYVMPDTVMHAVNFRIPIKNIKLNPMTRELWNVNFPQGYNNVGNALPRLIIPDFPAANNALQFLLYPAPDAVYSVSYLNKIRVSDMANDADVSIIPPEFQDVIIGKTLIKVFRKLNDPNERQDVWAKEYQTRFAKMWKKNEEMMPEFVNYLRDFYLESMSSPILQSYPYLY